LRRRCAPFLPRETEFKPTSVWTDSADGRCHAPRHSGLPNHAEDFAKPVPEADGQRPNMRSGCDACSCGENAFDNYDWVKNHDITSKTISLAGRSGFTTLFPILKQSQFMERMQTALLANSTNSGQGRSLYSCLGARFPRARSSNHGICRRAGTVL